MSALVVVGVPLIVAWFAGWWLEAHIAKGARDVAGLSVDRVGDRGLPWQRVRLWAVRAYGHLQRIGSALGAQGRAERRVLTYHQKVYAESHPRLHAMKQFTEVKR